MASRFAMSPGFSGALHNAYNPGSMIDGAQKGRSLQSQAIATTEANEANAIRLGDARVAMAKSEAGGIEALGAAKGNIAMMGGLQSGVQGLAGGLGKMGGGSPFKSGPASDMGVMGMSAKDANHIAGGGFVETVFDKGVQMPSTYYQS